MEYNGAEYIEEDVPRRGRPGYPAYFDRPLAQNEQHVLRGYPFYGTLLKVRPTGEPAFVTHISEARPMTLDQVTRLKRLRGDYILCLCDEDGLEIPLHIGDEPEEAPQPETETALQKAYDKLFRQNAELSEDLAGVRKRLMDEVEDYRRRYAQVQEDLAALRAQHAQELAAERDRHREEIRSLESRLHDSQMQLIQSEAERKAEAAIAELREEHAESLADMDLSTGELLMQKLIDLVPGLAETLPALLAGQGKPVPQLNDGTDESMVHALKQKIVQMAMQAALADVPDLAGFATAWNAIRAQSTRLSSTDWVDVARTLVVTAMEHAVAPGRVADVLEPVVGELGPARAALSVMTPKQAAKMLLELAGIDPGDEARSYLINVLTELKGRTNE